MRAQQRNSFLDALMVLSAHVIQADGKIMHSEMEHVRSFLRNSFGEAVAVQGNDTLLRLFDFHKQNGERVWQDYIRRACYDLVSRMEGPLRLQLLAYLCDIAKADGKLDEREVNALKEIATYLGFTTGTIDAMLHLGGESLDDAYAVLGINKDATDDEVRKAYKRMVLQHHSDKVATLGEDVKAAATKKMQEINEAKRRIYEARGMK
ncbi:MAG: TerB family tellurite resistance protein [Alloprevotella sp.]